MRERTLVVVSAGLSRPSSTRLLADQLSAAAVTEAADQRIPLAVTVVEVRDLAHDLATHLLTGVASAELEAALARVGGADALIAVSPIFAAGYSGLFKQFFDVVDQDALTGKPVLIAATAGTARHSLALEHALRPLFTYLRAVVVPTAVFAATDDWGAGSPGTPGGGGTSGDGIPGNRGTSGDGLAGSRLASDGGTLRDRVTRAAGELVREIGRREPAVAPDPFALPPGFEDLLNGRPPGH